MDDEEECKCPPPGSPAWMGTFADLMSLLMCFFILLLAFSEMDAKKYKQVAGSMSEAFGVQNEFKKKDVPRGTSIIAQEFSPGRPDPTPLNVVQQQTTDITKSTLDVICEKNSEGKDDTENGAPNAVLVIDKLKELIKQTESDAMNVASELEGEIRSGQVEVETRGRDIIIRVRENGSFSSGSAKLQAAFVPIMVRIRDVLGTVPGTIAVEGHSDSIPIRTTRFRSNWDLSSARAVSVAHELLNGDVLAAERFRVSGFADSRPLVEEDTPAKRAENRRVEIVVSQEEVGLPEKELSADGSMEDIPHVESPQEQVSGEPEIGTDAVDVDADVVPDIERTLNVTPKLVPDIAPQSGDVFSSDSESRAVIDRPTPSTPPSLESTSDSIDDELF